ncbi:DNA mismatch repair protein msh6 [Cryptotrichosporon argae]
MAPPAATPGKEQGDSKNKTQKQSTLTSFFGTPRAAPATTPARPLAAARQIPSSGATPTRPLATSSSTASAVTRISPAAPVRALPAPAVLDDELTPPPEEMDVDGKVAAAPKPRASATRTSRVAQAEMEIDSDEDDASPVVRGRRVKRKVVYNDPDESDDSEAEIKPKARPRKSLKADSDDEFFFDATADAELAAFADAYEATIASDASSPVKSPAPALPKKKKSGFVVPTSVPKKTTMASYPSSDPVELSSSTPACPSSRTAASRPGPTPLRRQGSGSASASSSNFMLTAAERRKIEAKEEKEQNEDCFEFLRDIQDKEGNRPGDPDYDPRTIKIAEKYFKKMSPFEQQFWTIKKDHFDTVLFFQKGKFYELYEDDAAIGHQEFDLKLTDRVKMKMVGVPEQSFEFWASKFLAAGYKVGKVEQAETAIGMEMRTKNGQKSGGREIVRRELQQVFTNGTIVDGTYLTTDEANHCVAIKEFSDEGSNTSSFGICVMDASTGEFNLSAFEDDVCRTRLETMFRQIRPKELVHSKNNLSVPTMRLLRNILPSSTLWQSFRDGKEFLSADDTIAQLNDYFGSDADAVPEAIKTCLDRPLAIEALGGMLFYLRSLNLDKDLISQKNFNIYDPIRQGKSLILDGQTLGHMEVLVNNEGTEEGTLLQLLQRCQTPFGKRLFRIWLTSPLRDASAINDRLDAIEDLMHHPTFSGHFTQLCKGIPDLERLISRIHAGSLKQGDFLKVVENFGRLQGGFETLLETAGSFESASVLGLLRNAPNITQHLHHIRSKYKVKNDEKSFSIIPEHGADAECDAADDEVIRIEAELDDLLMEAKKVVKGDVQWYHSVQGNKEVYQLQVPASAKVPSSWDKAGATKQFARYYTRETRPLVREIQEAWETRSTAQRSFYKRLLQEFDNDRSVWLNFVRVLAELDCLVSLAKASSEMDEPKCRPTFVDSPSAFVDFVDLRHPSMCLKRDFIPNTVQLGDVQPRQVLLTGPNMAGKSTLLRMTAAGVILAQLGCYVPAAEARLSPIDRIQTRMGAYDNMFASASTFKVELDECSKILHEAGPKSLVILDELGRGTSTYDGMAIAGAVLHHIATHTLPLGFFATHYGSLTDDFAYHPNIRNMHMQVHVDDDRGVIFLYKLIAGHAESSHGTHVARLAGVPDSVVSRADQVSAQFFAAFKDKLEARRQSVLPLMAQADFAWLVKLAAGEVEETTAPIGMRIDMVRRCIAGFRATGAAV